MAYVPAGAPNGGVCPGAAPDPTGPPSSPLPAPAHPSNPVPEVLLVQTALVLAQSPVVLAPGPTPNPVSNPEANSAHATPMSHYEITKVQASTLNEPQPLP